MSVKASELAWPPVLILVATWVLAIGAWLLGVHQVREALAQPPVAVTHADLPKIKALRRPVGDQVALRFAEALKTSHPGVKVENLAGSVVRVSVSRESSYAEWLSLLGSAVLFAEPGTAAHTRSVCAGQCGEEVFGVVEFALVQSELVVE